MTVLALRRSVAAIPAARLAQPAGVALSLLGLSKSFGGAEVLRDVDLDIAPGQFVAIVGQSGCGKSTLLRLLAGLDRPSRGRLAFDGREVKGRGADARIMFQEARLLPWRRVADNVGLGLSSSGKSRRTRHDEALAALREVGLDSRAGDWPSVLSGGQRQRVALARALVSHPRLLLLDEPLGALDALTRIDMQSLVETVWRHQGFTAVLVTHDVAEAIALADRVVMIEQGRVTLDLPIDLPRPRARGDAAFAALEGEVLSRLLARPVQEACATI